MIKRVTNLTEGFIMWIFFGPFMCLIVFLMSFFLMTLIMFLGLFTQQSHHFVGTFIKIFLMRFSEVNKKLQKMDDLLLVLSFSLAVSLISRSLECAFMLGLMVNQLFRKMVGLTGGS